jgi:uncharacterized protein (TIGR00369 family)
MEMTMAERIHGIVSRDVLTAEPGLAFLRGMLEGRHPAPPFSRTTNVYMILAEEGRVVFEGEPTESFFNPLGTIHGGWTSAILDSAMACAVHSTLNAGQGYTTVEMKLNFVRPILPNTGKVTCEGFSSTAEGHLRLPRASCSTPRAGFWPTAPRPA